jgi:hypothetical protein
MNWRGHASCHRLRQSGHREFYQMLYTRRDDFRNVRVQNRRDERDMIARGLSHFCNGNNDQKCRAYDDGMDDPTGNICSPVSFCYGCVKYTSCDYVTHLGALKGASFRGVTPSNPR